MWEIPPSYVVVLVAVLQLKVPIINKGVILCAHPPTPPPTHPHTSHTRVCFYNEYSYKELRLRFGYLLKYWQFWRLYHKGESFHSEKDFKHTSDMQGRVHLRNLRMSLRNSEAELENVLIKNKLTCIARLLRLVIDQSHWEHIKFRSQKRVILKQKSMNKICLTGALKHGFVPYPPPFHTHTCSLHISPDFCAYSKPNPQSARKIVRNK